MKGFCLDTNVIIDLILGEGAPKEKFDELQSQGECFLNPIILCELYKGAYLSTKSITNIGKIEESISGLDVLEINKEACRLYGTHFAHLQKLGRPTSDFNLLIGCIAKSHQVILVTRNAKEFKDIEGLQVREW